MLYSVEPLRSSFSFKYLRDGSWVLTNDLLQLPAFANSADPPLAMAAPAPRPVMTAPPVMHLPRTPLNTTLEIIFAHDYYQDLGVQPGASTISIERGFDAKKVVYSPASDAAKLKYASADPNVVQRVTQNWIRIRKAYQILSDINIRAYYDQHRVFPTQSGPRASRQPSPSRGTSKNQQIFDPNKGYRSYDNVLRRKKKMEQKGENDDAEVSDGDSTHRHDADDERDFEQSKKPTGPSAKKRRYNYHR